MNTKGLQGYLLFAILGGFVAWMIWGQSKIEVDVKAYQDKIDKLEKKVDSLHAENTHLEIESDSLLQEISDYCYKYAISLCGLLHLSCQIGNLLL